MRDEEIVSLLENAKSIRDLYFSGKCHPRSFRQAIEALADQAEGLLDKRKLNHRKYPFALTPRESLETAVAHALKGKPTEECYCHGCTQLRERDEMNSPPKLTREAAFRAAQAVYSTTRPLSEPGPQILLTGGEIVRLFEVLLKDYAPRKPADILVALEDAISIIESIDGRDNSCNPKTDISDLKAIVAKAKGI